MTSFILQVQSKAVDDRECEAETPTSFVYRVKENDLRYWLQGNAPVLLVGGQLLRSGAQGKVCAFAESGLTHCRLV
jgi:hypothetical protein